MERSFAQIAAHKAAMIDGFWNFNRDVRRKSGLEIQYNRVGNEAGHTTNEEHQ